MSVGSDEDKTTEERLQILVGCCRAVVKNRFWAVVKSCIRYKYIKNQNGSCQGFWPAFVKTMAGKTFVKTVAGKAAQI